LREPGGQPAVQDNKKLMRQDSGILPALLSVQVLGGGFVISFARGDQESENCTARRAASKNVVGRLRLR
jgi:hypothetical protein